MTPPGDRAGALRAGGWSGQVCWPCGGTAEAEHAFVAHLVADPARLPDAQGYPVVIAGREARLRVPIPRCGPCRARSRAGGIRMVLGMVVGAALLGGGYWWSGPGSDRPAWFVVVNAAFTAAVLSFVGALAGTTLCVLYAFAHDGARPRSYDDFPPVAALRALGWACPESH